MTLIADSDAVQDIRRILPQHQSALTLLNSRLQNPAVDKVLWLDLACGKGQIISQLNENLSNKHREKLSYMGYDINIDHTRAAERIASSLNLHKYDFFHGDIYNFDTIVPNEHRFDFITCTNTAHELQPGSFASILIDSLVRLSGSGELFIYDMESLSSPELGALPWRSSEIGKLLNSAFEILETEFRVHPSIWSHTSCKGWTVTIQRNYIGKTDQEISERRRTITDQLEKEIDNILEARFKECNRLLESFCRFGTETADDANAKQSALYEFWAINRAKEVRS